MGMWAILGLGAAVVALMMSQKKKTAVPTKKALPKTTKTKAAVAPVIKTGTKQLAPAIPYTPKEKKIVGKVMKSKISDPKKQVIAKLAQIAASPDTVTSPATKAKAKRALETIKASPEKVSQLPTEEKVLIAKAATESITPTPTEAAEVLKKYLGETHSYGTKTLPDETVKRCQSYMGGLVADGIYGPKTRERARQLGVSIPARS